MASKNIRHSKHITNKEDIEFLITLKEEDVTTSFIMETFGEFNNKSRFNPYDTIDIPIGSYGKEGKKNKNVFTTTVGIWVFNRYFIEQDLFDLFGYVNETISKKSLGKLNSDLSYALLEDKITLPQLKKFLMKTQKVMPYVSILSPSQTMMMLTCTNAISKKEEELYKKYKKELDSGDEVVAEKVEKELLDFAKELLKDDPSLDSFDSGARGSFGNNFKNMYVMKGATSDPDPNAAQKYKVLRSNYMKGISREDYTDMAKSLSSGPFKRSVKTAVGGYWEKLILNAFQHVILDKSGSDCKTKRYIEVDFSKQSISDYMYSYVIEGQTLVEITSETKSKYDKKKVKIRFSSMCESTTGTCNKCAGNLFNRMGLTNIGMAMPITTSTLKNLSMKSMHESLVKTVEMNPIEVFGY